MTRILLTGAGFSHNWGTWLSSEAFEYLLGWSGLDAATRAMLWEDKNNGRGFESTLERLRQSDSANQQFTELTLALGRMFDFMNQLLREKKFEFQQQADRYVGLFLAGFDAIFTLNQDLLLERHYQPGANLYLPNILNSAYSPGIGPPAPNEQWNGDREYLLTARRAPLPAAEFKIQTKTQPYFKLHGSANWVDAEGGRMLIMGGGKSRAISSIPLLNWYSQAFAEYLNRPGARLMVIGYAFRDEHINEAIVAGALAGLKIFIVDPAGTDVIDHRDPKALIGQRCTPLMEALQPAIIGASRRPLSAIFGDDVIEHRKIMAFTCQ
jgi:hypothetical protein